MARGRMKWLLGPLVVAALLAAAQPALAAGRDDGGQAGVARAPWALARQAVERLWSGAIGALGLRPVVERGETHSPPGEVNGAGETQGPAAPSASGDQGGALDPTG